MGGIKQERHSLTMLEVRSLKSGDQQGSSFWKLSPFLESPGEIFPLGIELKVHNLVQENKSPAFKMELVLSPLSVRRRNIQPILDHLTH